jgi:hypothetical protein
MRKVKIYSSSSTIVRNVELDTDVYDPYIGLPDEREQKRGLEEQLSMPRAGSISTTTLEMSMPATRLTDQSFSLEMSIPALIALEMSMPATRLTDQSFSLEMSMPATSLTDQSFSLEMSMPATGLTDQSFSHPPVQGGAIGSVSTTTTILETPMPIRSRRLTDQSVPYLPVEGATNAMMAVSEIAENSAMTTGHSSVAAFATIVFVSAIAGVVAFM